MNENDKKYIIRTVEVLTDDYDKIVSLLKDNNEALQYFEEAIAKLEHCIDSIYNK